MGNGKLAVVTGASSGIGRELAKLCAKDGYDLVIVADEPAIEQAAEALRSHGVSVDAVEADLARENGADKLIAEIGDRDIDLLFLNAGRGLGRGFVDQDWNEARRVIDTNITGTVYLAHRLGRKMVGRGRGRILFTGSIAGFTPGTFQAVYNGTKAFIDSFAIALRHELKDSGVSVTVLMPGATQTRFFERADMMDTEIGVQEKDNPADVARDGYDALMAGEEQVVSGWKNKMQAAAAHVTPAGTLAEQHRNMAEPGSAKNG
ncbi:MULTISPECIES: SDR family NAD(P)-dependent oxidoreductase [unclassified Mesorhizobium]|uniref:SDR family NAD(P)-dependent oxidoreductase n=1 Tax=unclassified Mesorhizobium TaxID=325217 RepID=UPI000F75A563|nr:MULTISPECIES: SDR family NAD(P)-dependent oxidoreductase [unclassified Mesorhizobium]AZO05529.1 SDR family NAD(P)-dependent oxidoreductase [Mesorhizobium sp. M2A.F.Ca.ET.043.02.1.1]RUW40272.1 SDR family NAD(P)-dependent oxidoreductase [Mesorhizobium sp. M2A.F.Ca.ET.015.02.1.1]RUW78389.1 SDR family NAD(P)-dependent oxidoreductase [Mesorhizobium sp. M2A.F.Ca.ET.067.02.1.1]RVC98440.1 SDR family NAD(P)-dependent oxidoreductase [Mesorhizobium sp. M2A.F.Ca.ET.017.03.2.1]RVD09958.1 SDR family NAD(